MDYSNLNDTDIDEIINRLKHPVNNLSFDEINTTISSLFGRIDVDESIIDTEDITYVLSIFRGKRKAERFTISLRLKDYHDHIVRVDINPSNRHVNPDGSVVTGSHFHIYSNQYDKRDSVAIPLETSDFPNVSLIVDVFDAFVHYTNIRKEDGND